MKIDRAYLANRAAKTVAAGYAVPKWITFCAWALDIGLYVQLYDAVTTVSKYVYLSKHKDGKRYKIRFSNHKPNKAKELEEDCDFFVGVTNTGVRTTGDAMAAVTAWLTGENKMSYKAHKKL